MLSSWLQLRCDHEEGGALVHSLTTRGLLGCAGSSSQLLWRNPTTQQNMSEPSPLMLEAADKEALRHFYNNISQLKRQISLRIGKPGSGDFMHSVTSLTKLLGHPPSQSRVALGAAQANDTMEVLTCTTSKLHD